VIAAAVAAGWLLHAAHWSLALRQAGRAAAGSGEWRRELAIRAGMLLLLVAAVAAPPAVRIATGPVAQAALLAVFFGGHVLAMGGRAALAEAWSIGTRPRAGARPRRHGLYRAVRHPIYAGVTVAAAAQLLLLQNVPSLLLLAGALTVCAVKVRAEERWLRPEAER
jgi:protein-S-isoprenylcysteine O-methyltransferase Ste14